MRKDLRSVLATVLLIATLFQNAMSQNTTPYWSLAGNSNATTSSKLGTTNNVYLRFVANNVERGRINTNGNWGIGDAGTDARLTIGSAAGTRAFRVRVGGDTKLAVQGNGGVTVGTLDPGPANGLYVVGDVGIGTATPHSKLHVIGQGIFSNGLYLNNGGMYCYNASNNAIEAVTSAASGIGVYGSGQYGLYGFGFSYGVYGDGNNYGVSGKSYNGYGGFFESYENYGLVASTDYGKYAGVFYGDVLTTGSYISSDKALKQNAQEFEGAMDIINKLKPRNYEFKTDAKYAFLHLPKGSHYGLMAQDVEEVLPNLVSTTDHQDMKPAKPEALKKDANGRLMPPSAAKQPASQKGETISIKAVNYTELIPIVVKGMQEQQQQLQAQKQLIETQQQQIDELKNLVRQLTKDRSGITVSGMGLLEQATPNPAKGTTRISYNLPQGASRAQLLLTDATGRTVKTVSLNNSGFTTLNTAGFATGIYNYSLLVDGKIVDTKKLTVARN